MMVSLNQKCLASQQYQQPVTRVHAERRMASLSVLDTKPSHILDFPLTVCQQIWLIFLLPTICLTVIYITSIATDIAVGLQLINEGHILPGSLTLIIILFPPIINYFISISSPPDTKELTVVFMWLSIETAALLLFPIRLLHCFAERLFWSIEAMRSIDPKREEALIEFERTYCYRIENYLFMQAFLQAGPQAILQTFLIIRQTSKEKGTEIVQVLCLLSSLAFFAFITSSYHRYETQVQGGRHQVWSHKDTSQATLLNSSESEINLEYRRNKSVKAMEEDNPLGSILLFLFWFLFLFARIFSLVLASTFFPWAVFGVCVAHYLFSLAYILPTPDCKTSIPVKVILAFVYIFGLIEVSITFRKSYLFYSLFFSFTLIENISLTLLWAIWANYNGIMYYYSLYLIGFSHGLATIFLIIYFKFFKPRVINIEPNN